MYFPGPAILIISRRWGTYFGIQQVSLEVQESCKVANSLEVLIKISDLGMERIWHKF